PCAIPLPVHAGDDRPAPNGVAAGGRRMSRWSSSRPLRRFSAETRGLAHDSSLLGLGTAATTIGMIMQVALITHGLGLRQYGLFALVVAVVALVDKFFQLDASRVLIVFSAPYLERNLRRAAGVFQF